MSNTVSAAPRPISRSVMARPSPRAPPLTITFFPWRSTSARNASVAKDSPDPAHALKRHDLVERELAAELLLQRGDDLHVLQGIPGRDVVHVQIVGDGARRYLQQFAEEILEHGKTVCHGE
jgi:hypothetical protein